MELIQKDIKKDESVTVDETPLADTPTSVFAFCPSCGFKNENSFAFCPSCGNDLKQ